MSRGMYLMGMYRLGVHLMGVVCVLKLSDFQLGVFGKKPLHLTVHFTNQHVTIRSQPIGRVIADWIRKIRDFESECSACSSCQ
jgi:hypothetical protein